MHEKKNEAIVPGPPEKNVNMQQTNFFKKPLTSILFFGFFRIETLTIFFVHISFTHLA